MSKLSTIAISILLILFIMAGAATIFLYINNQNLHNELTEANKKVTQLSEALKQNKEALKTLESSNQITMEAVNSLFYEKDSLRCTLDSQNSALEELSAQEETKPYLDTPVPPEVSDFMNSADQNYRGSLSIPKNLK